MYDSKMRNISREMETMKKNQMKNLQLKNKISEGKKKKKEQGLSPVPGVQVV